LRITADKSQSGPTGYRGIHNLGAYLRLAAPVGALFALVYFGSNWITARRPDNYQLYFDWELAIPFLPGMIYAYASIVVLVLLPALTLTRNQLRKLTRAIVITLLVAALIYLLLPADLGFQRPARVPGYDTVYQALYALEMPHNLLPSLHIACATLLIAAIRNNSASRWIRLGLVLWGVVICASVVLVHQHHVLDVASGLLLGLGTYRLVYLRARQ
jgi:membrane-associated phospholipid phosphatase